MSKASSRRKLAAILMADVVEYGRHMAEDETSTIRTLKAHRAVFSSFIQQLNGRVVDAKGDAIMAEFASVVDAVVAAVQIQSRIDNDNESLSERRRLYFRIGINLGDVLQEPDSIYGNGVTVAARLETLAEPGGICIARNVHEQVEGKLPLKFEYLGEHPVKTQTVEAYKVVVPAAAMMPGAFDAVIEVPRLTPKRTKSWFAIGVAGLILLLAILLWTTQRFDDKQIAGRLAEAFEGPSIAVLPFTNMSGDPEQEYFADGITDTLITDLSKLRNVLVIARNSAFTYKNKPVDIREVGRELGVQYVLEGSVQKASDRIRLNAQLIKADSGEHLWAERFDRPFDDVFVVQDEVTQQIVMELEVELVEGENARMWRHATGNPDAYDAFMRGRQHFFRFNREDQVQAAFWLEKAIALDPEYAIAHALLSGKNMIDYRYGWSDSPQMSLERTATLARRAIALDGEEPMGYFMLGYYHFIKGQDKQANAEFKKGFALNANHAFGVGLYAITLMYQTRYDEALDYFARMGRLSPIGNPGNLHFLGETYRLLGRHDEAIEVFTEILGMAPRYMGVRVKLICAYVAAGRLEEARSEMKIFRHNHPAFTVTQFRNDWAPRMSSYRDPDEIGRMAQLLRTAGLPE